MTAEAMQPQPTVPTDSLANRLVLIRRELGLSQREAALRCGVGFGSWQSWENGSAPRYALRDLVQVAARLNIDRDWLLFGGQLRPETNGGGGPSTAGLPLLDVIDNAYRLPRRSGHESPDQDVDLAEGAGTLSRKADLLAYQKDILNTAIPRNPQRIR